METGTGYSDPIYDRIERTANFLSARWKLLVITFILALGIGFALQARAEMSPEAASAAAYGKAQGDREALAALIASPDHSSAIKASAAS